MAQPCPRVDPLRPPTLPRDQPGLLKYGAVCMPGTATAGGCADDQKYWAVVVAWNDVVGPTGWTAPGGNRYWASVTPANAYNPMAKAILRLMAERSRKHTQNVFKNWDDYKNLTMAQVLAKTQGKLATQYGIVKIEIDPNPNETAAQFAARGGYLLWIDPETGPFASRTPLDGYKPSWVAGNVRTCQLYGRYNLGTQQVEYSIRVDYKDTWQKVIEGTLGRLNEATTWFCDSISGEKATQAAVAATLYPGAQAYVAAWGAARGLCATRMTPPEPCEPRADQPLPATPTIAPTSWKGAMTASGASSAATIPSGVLSPVTNTAAASTMQYPEGTIAWYDTSAGGYRLAVPFPGDGYTHAPLSAGVTAAIPAGVTLVTKGAWEKATLPWLRRGSTKIGMMIGGIALASAATVYVSRVSG